MAVATEHRISRDDVIWAFGPDLVPVLEVEPGDVVTFETNDCFTGQIRSEADLVTAMVAPAKARLAKAVTGGKLSQAQADQALTKLQALATRLAEKVFPTK